jgi:hypothetical protein
MALRSAFLKTVVLLSLGALDCGLGILRVALNWELDWGAIGASAESTILKIPHLNDRIREPNPAAYQQS